MTMSRSLEIVEKQSPPAFTIPPAPRGLSAEAKTWWRKLNETYEFGDESLLLLQQALEALDELRAAQKILAREGITMRDRWGQRKTHPASIVARDSRSAMLKYFQAMHLNLEPINEIGRPPGA